MDNKKNYTNKPTTTKENSDNSSFDFAFSKINYILIAVGILILGIGYILLCGGGSDDPNVFNPAMFDNRRLVVAPIMIVAGLVIEIVAIMIRPKTKE
jgi:hypothetical protein